MNRSSYLAVRAARAKRRQAARSSAQDVVETASSQMETASSQMEAATSKTETPSSQSSYDPLTSLPFELTCQILLSECLDAATLVRLRQVCRGWKKLCDNDEIWRRAAQIWGYAPNPSLTVEEIKRSKLDENGYFGKVKTWKDFCVAQEALNAELGDDRSGQEMQYPMSYYFHAAQSEKTQGVWQDLWCMKIMPEDGTIVSTGIAGGVRVSDLHTHKLLWSKLPENGGKRCPHLEAEKGFIIWNADTDNHESVFMVHKSEKLFKNPPRKRGHYRLWKEIRHGAVTRAFRFKYPHLAIVTSDRDVIFWDVETGAKQRSFSIGESELSFERINYLDFDSEYAYICGQGPEGPELHVFRREDGRLVWSLASGRPNLKVPTAFDLNFDQKMDADSRNRSASELDGDSKMGGVYRATVEPIAPTENWLNSLFTPDPNFQTIVRRWQAIHICEETNTLVFCCNGVLCLLKDYKRFFQDPSKDPEWFAAYRFSAHDWRSRRFPSIINDLLSTDSSYDTNRVGTSLSVQKGRALWVSVLPFILDWRNAKSVEDVKINLLWQDYENISRERPDLSFKVDPSKLRAAPKHEKFRLRQFPHSAYKYTLCGTSSAVLTETAAYIVETQARRTKHKNARGVCRGGYGPERQQKVALRTVRCFDWGRSALLRIDKTRCHAEIEAFTELREQQTVHSNLDYRYHDWTDALYQRVMRWHELHDPFAYDDWENEHIYGETSTHDGGDWAPYVDEDFDGWAVHGGYDEE